MACDVAAEAKKRKFATCLQLRPCSSAMHRLADVTGPTSHGCSNFPDLLLSRIGYFVDWSKKEQSNAILAGSICSVHLDQLGSGWANKEYKNFTTVRKNFGCSFTHPGVPTPSVSRKEDFATTRNDAKFFLLAQKAVLPVGTPCCSKHLQWVRTMKADQDEEYVLVKREPPKPSKTPSTADPSVKQAVFSLCDQLGLDNVARRSDWVNLDERQKRRKASIVKGVLNAVLEVVAPDAMGALREKSFPGTEKSNPSGVDALLEDVSSLYNRAENRTHRLHILSTVARLPYSLLVRFFPGLSSYMHQQAKRVAAGASTENRRRCRRERYCKAAVDTFVSFILSPSVSVILPFSERSAKTAEGVKFNLPNAVRLSCAESVYKLYLMWMEERGQGHAAIKRTTALSIINVIVPTQRKSLSCVDEIVADAMNSYDELFAILNTLSMEGLIDTETRTSVTRRLSEGKSYLRSDFKVVETHDRLTLMFDPNILRCEAAFDAISELRMTVDECVEDSVRTRELFEIVDQCEETIRSLMMHQVRVSVSTSERAQLLEKMEPGHALVTADWAQKLLPMYSREKQSDYFGKSGISYHVTYTTANIGGELCSHTTVHIVGESTEQNGILTAHLVRHALQELSDIGIKEVVIRSDNASSYKCGDFIKLMHNSKDVDGLAVKGLMFSEVQAGKSGCDRGASLVKTKLREYVNGGHNVTDTLEFFEALQSGIPLNSTSYYVVDVLSSKPGTGSIPGIKSFSSFLSEGSEVRVRRHQSIGEGRAISVDGIREGICDMKVLEVGGILGAHYWLSKSPVQNRPTNPSDPSDPKDSDSTLIPCIDDACTSEFLSFHQFNAHLDRGVHKYESERESLVDYVVRSASLTLDTLQSAQNQILLNAILSDRAVANESQTFSPGWALRNPSTRNENDRPAREFVKEYFLERRKNDLKAEVRVVHSMMKEKKKKDGSSYFPPRNQLTQKQIKAIFRNLLDKEKKGLLQYTVDVDSVEPETDGDSSDDEEEVREVILMNKHEIFEVEDEDDTSVRQKRRV